MVDVADFNNDRANDIVSANSGSANVSVRLGNGDGTFGAETTYTVGTTPDHVHSAGINGDGNTYYRAFAI